jgi:hypothetical protein
LYEEENKESSDRGSLLDEQEIHNPAPPPGRWALMKNNWKWFGVAGHFICGRWCQFHLCTQVGEYLVSTVGEYWPERGSREIHAKVCDPKWLMKNWQLKGDEFDAAYMKRFGFQDIGCDRKYETMVFRAGKPCDREGCKCGLPSIDPSNLDFLGYNNAKDATAGHMKLCKKWAKKP